MIEFGKSLRTAREAKGLTLSQVAESTHMLSQIIDGLEKEDFSQIVAPIYGRGFVKLYCEAVGLEPKPFIDQFMQLYNHSAPKVETPSPVKVEASPMTQDQAGNPVSVWSALRHFRLHARMLAMAGAAGIVILLLILGLRALYHATATADSAPIVAAESETEPTDEVAVPADADTPRQPLPVKPFYAD